MKELNRLCNRKKYFIFKSLSIFINTPTITLKASKKRDFPLPNMFPLLTLFIAEMRHRPPCSLLHSTSEITAIDVGPLDSKHTLRLHTAADSDGDVLLLIMCLRMLKADGVPETADYKARKYQKE